ncbi:DUF1501 domain-containing protein [Pirellulaceae bacterium SH449]
MRRQFLKWCGIAGLGFAVPYRFHESVRAAPTDSNEGFAGPYYLVFNASGGWDTTYLMDPKGVNGINRLFAQGDILTHGAHTFAPTRSHAEEGMPNESFYEKFGSELLTINGLDYSVDNHAPASRYMATGKLDSLEYPTFAALVAACRGQDCPLAFLTFGNYSVTGNLVAMSRVPYLQSLQRIANADSVHGNSKSPYHDPFVMDHVERTLAEYHESLGESPRLPRAARSESMLYGAQLNSKALARVTEYIPKEMPKNRLHQQAEIALVGFKAGVSVSANLNIGQFDSHANNDQDQLKLIPELLDGVAYAMRRAEELGIREKLVVVMQSEMGRTPKYNSGNGKDHWSVGSAMFLGSGIGGNRVIGATDDQQFAAKVDPESWMLDSDKGIRIRPEHIHLALRELAGIQDHPYALRFPLSISESCDWSKLWRA